MEFARNTILGLLVIMIGCVVFFVSTYLYREYQFSKVPVVETECILLSHNFSPSTQKTRVAPIVGVKGDISCAVYATGNEEKKVTVWDCGKYGRLISEKKRIYQYARERSILLIRHSSYDTRIVGIKIDDEDF